MFHPEGDRLVGTVVPNVPTWAVFYDSREDSLLTAPIMFFNVWEIRAYGKLCVEMHPVSFSTDGLGEVSELNNFLGLSLVETPDPEAWTREI